MNYSQRDVTKLSEEQMKLMANEALLASDGFVIFCFRKLSDDESHTEIITRIQTLSILERSLFIRHMNDYLAQINLGLINELMQGEDDNDIF